MTGVPALKVVDEVVNIAAQFSTPLALPRPAFDPTGVPEQACSLSVIVPMPPCSERTDKVSSPWKARWTWLSGAMPRPVNR